MQRLTKPSFRAFYKPLYLLPVMGVAAATLVAVLSSCGGSGGSDDSGGGSSIVSSGRFLLLDPTRSNAETAISGLQYATAGTTSGSDGSYSHTSTTLTVYLGTTPVTVTAQSALTQQHLAAAVCAGSTDPACTDNATQNIERFLLSTDTDHNASNGIQLAPYASTLNLAWSASPDQFEAALAQQLAPLGVTVAALFTPSLGINSEAAQAERNDVMQSMPFVDIFRTARPMTEFNTSNCATFDAQGWPTSAPSNTCIIRTIFLNNVNAQMLPEGEYTVLYDGEGTLSYANYGQLVSHSPGRDVVDIRFNRSTDTNQQRLDVRLTTNNTANPVRNIRILMPGGVCEGNPFVRVADASGCPAGAYRSFEETFKANRNAPVFNPDYMRFLKDFRVVRMMNLMEASPSYLTCPIREAEKDNPVAYLRHDQTCLAQPFQWSQRSTMDDAVWGGSANTPRLNRYGRGVPLEMQVELANQLNAHPWFNLPHNATDDYVAQFATYVRDHLKPGLKAHVEYTNEAWNPSFWGNLYVQQQGMLLGLGNNYTSKEYWAGALYYAKRAAEIFTIWENVYQSDTSRLVRILGTYQADQYLTRNMLNHRTVKNHVDAIATGAYFYACWKRDSKPECKDTTKIPKTLSEVTSLDDVFAAIDNTNDPYGLAGLQKLIAAQAKVAKDFGKVLYAYEGGQHLVLFDTADMDDARKAGLLDFFRAANRDPRMGERYQTLLNAWKTEGGQQFMLYTQPQSYHPFGSFGIKETLNQPRTQAPKYDGAMKFQESQGKCWWNGC